MIFELTDVEARVLGCLIEKKITTPDYYPLTLNALNNACNQKSNRDPVVQYDEKTVVRALDTLRDKKMALMITSTSSRVPKYEEQFCENYRINDAQSAILCELLLRGPQTFGELRGRASRMHRFETLEEVQDVLDELAGHEAGTLVMQLPRQAGRKEPRWTQLLTGEPEILEEEMEPQLESVRLAVQNEDERIAKLENEIALLKQEFSALEEQFKEFRNQFE